PFYGLRPHGLDGQRAPTTIEDMAADYIKEIQSLQSEGPYFLGGYSLGGIVAFEIAQQLRKQGQEVASPVLFDPDNFHSQFMPLAGSVNVPTKMAAFRDTLTCHFRALTPLCLHEKLVYALGRLKDMLGETLGQTERASKKIVCQLFLGIGRRVPHPLRPLDDPNNSSTPRERVGSANEPRIP